MATLMPNGRQQFTDSAGVPLVGGAVYTYAAGTSTPKATFTDYTGATPLANPVLLDARGEATIFWSGAYKVVLMGPETSPGVRPTIWTQDNYRSLAATSDITEYVATYAALRAYIGDSVTVHVGGNTTYFDGAHGTFAYDAADTTSADNGGTIIVATNGKRWKRQITDYVHVNDFVTGGLGTEASPWTGWSTAITWSARTTYCFKDGHYAYATSPNFAKDHLRLRASHATVLRHTGTGYAVVCDAGATTGDIVGVDICIRVEGNINSTGGFHQRGCSRSKFDISFRNVPGTCFEDSSGVLNIYNLEHTAFVYGETIQPSRLLNVTRRAVGQESSANVYYTRAENCTLAGLNLSFCLNSMFISGTSEANGGGVYIETTSEYNTFINADFETNTGLDIECRGNHNRFINCLSTATARFQGLKNMICGGTYNNIQSQGNANQFDACMYANAAGTFAETGTNTRKQSVYNATSVTYDVDEIPNTIKSLTIGTGGVSLDTTAIVGSAGGYVSAKVLLKVNDKSNLGTAHTFESVNGNPGNAAVCGLRLGGSSVTSRALNAGGTVNASGADYAEYFRKANGCPSVAKGQIVGITSTGEITDQWASAISFLVKSTDPSLVGGDTWALHLGPRPEEVDAQAAYDAAYEIERGKYDRLALCGQAPVNVLGASPGDYIVPVEESGLIGAHVVSAPTFAQYMAAIGRVVRLDESGRAVVMVKPI